jgi:hypothetical protein
MDTGNMDNSSFCEASKKCIGGYGRLKSSRQPKYLRDSPRKWPKNMKK